MLNDLGICQARFVESLVKAARMPGGTERSPTTGLQAAPRSTCFRAALARRFDMPGSLLPRP